MFTMSVGDAFYAMRQYDRTREQYERTLAIDENFSWGRLSLGAVYEIQGKSDEAIREYQKARVLAGGGSFGLLNLGHAYAESGRISEAHDALQQLLRLSEQGYSVSYDIAFVHLGLGEKEKAIAWLEKAYRDRASGLTNLGHEPLWDELRPDPRFASILNKMGLEAHLRKQAPEVISTAPESGKPPGRQSQR